MTPFNQVLKLISEQTLLKDSVNPHFKNKYASLDACQAVVLPILHNNGYELRNYTAIENGILVLYTEVLVSGETTPILRTVFPVGVVTEKPQQLGAGMTYARRYNLCSLFSLTADDDDDGNAAQGNPAPREPLEEKPRPSSRFRNLS